MKQSRKLFIIILFSMSLFFSGCQYGKDRLQDAGDIIQLEIGFGPGLFAGVQASDFFAPGLGIYFQNIYFGPLGRGRETAFSQAQSIGGAGLLYYYKETGFIPLDEKTAIEAPINSVSTALFGINYRDESNSSRRWPEMFSFSGKVHALFIGVGAGINPVELFDFIIGLSTLDICNDDGLKVPLQAIKSPRTSAYLIDLFAEEIEEALYAEEAYLKPEDFQEEALKIIRYRIERYAFKRAFSKAPFNVVKSGFVKLRPAINKAAKEFLKNLKVPFWQNLGVILDQKTSPLKEIGKSIADKYRKKKYLKK
jgi:hypothetical protein